MAAPKPSSPLPPRWLILLGAVALALVVGLGGRFLFLSPDSEPMRAAIGGPFSLVDQDGRPVTDREFRGKLMLVFFGYTYCPDVCPTELQVMSAVLDELGPKATDVQPIFVSVDPERDSPAVLKEYLSNFHERIVGLTGSPEQVAAAARAYRVYYAKARDTGSSADYLIDHSAFLYLMDRKGEYRAHFRNQTPPDEIVRRVRELL